MPTKTKPKPPTPLQALIRVELLLRNITGHCADTYWTIIEQRGKKYIGLGDYLKEAIDAGLRQEWFKNDPKHCAYERGPTRKELNALKREFLSP